MKPQQLPFDFRQVPAYARDDLWISASNHEAVAWVDRWPAWPSQALVIFGPVACGKTHLCHVWQKKSAAVDIAVPPDVLDAAAYILDDVTQKIKGDAAERRLLHFLNMLKESGKTLLMTDTAPPSQWPFGLPDLASRLRACQAVEIGAPDDAALQVILAKMFSDRQIFVGQDVIDYILSRNDRSLAALRSAVDMIDRRAIADKRAVTVPFVRGMLGG